MTILFCGCDVGGTNARAAVWEKQGSDEALHLRFVETYDAKRFGSVDELLERILKDAGAERFEVACVAVPGPVENETRMVGPYLPEQNATAWKADARNVESNLRIGKVILMNDFMAIGHGLSNWSDLLQLNDVVPVTNGVLACVGAGTGLGEVFCTWDSDHYNVWPSEGGMADFCALSPKEWELRSWLLRNNQVGEYPGGRGVCTVESVVSGPGIVNIYSFLCGNDAERISKCSNAEDVAQGAQDGDEICAEAIDMFICAYAQECRRKALDSMCFGGLYVAGGIAPKLMDRDCRASQLFAKVFLDDPVNCELLKKVPLFIVREGVPIGIGLAGARDRALRMLNTKQI